MDHNDSWGMTFNDVIKKNHKEFLFGPKKLNLFLVKQLWWGPLKKNGDGVMILQGSRDKEHSQRYFNLLIFKDTSRDLNM